MKKYSKKNRQKSKVSKKKNSNIQKGGAFETDIEENIKTLKQIMTTITDDNGNLLKIYESPAHTVFKKLSMKIHPDKHMENKDKYTKLFQVIGDFDDWVKRTLSPDTTWNEAIKEAGYSINSFFTPQSYTSKSSSQPQEYDYTNTPPYKPRVFTEEEKKSPFYPSMYQANKTRELHELLRQSERLRREMNINATASYEKEVSNLGFSIKEEIPQILEKSKQYINNENTKDDIHIYTSIDIHKLMRISQENINKMKQTLKIVSKDNNLLEIRELLPHFDNDIIANNKKIEPISEELIKYNKILKKKNLNYKTIIDTIKENILNLNNLEQLLIIIHKKVLKQHPLISIKLLTTQIEKTKNEIIKNIQSIDHDEYGNYPPKERYRHFVLNNKIIDIKLIKDYYPLNTNISSLNENIFILNYRWLYTEFKKYIANNTYLLATKQKYEDIKKDLEKTETLYLSLITKKTKEINEYKKKIKNNNDKIHELQSLNMSNETHFNNNENKNNNNKKKRNTISKSIFDFEDTNKELQQNIDKLEEYISIIKEDLKKL